MRLCGVGREGCLHKGSVAAGRELVGDVLAAPIHSEHIVADGLGQAEQHVAIVADLLIVGKSFLVKAVRSRCRDGADGC